MTIYTPYTYLIGWSKLSTYYYGVRFAKDCHPDDLWVTYFTSSKYVDEFRELNGEPDIIEVRKTFSNNPEAAREWEHKVLRRMKAVLRENFLNKTDNKSIDSKIVSIHMTENNPMSKSSALKKMKKTKTIRNLIKFVFNRAKFKPNKSKQKIERLEKYLEILKTSNKSYTRSITFIQKCLYECKNYISKDYPKNRKRTKRGKISAISVAKTGKVWYKSPDNKECVCVIEGEQPIGWVRGMVKSIKPIPPHLKTKKELHNGSFERTLPLDRALSS